MAISKCTWSSYAKPLMKRQYGGRNTIWSFQRSSTLLQSKMIRHKWILWNHLLTKIVLQFGQNLIILTLKLRRSTISCYVFWDVSTSRCVIWTLSSTLIVIFRVTKNTVKEFLSLKELPNLEEWLGVVDKIIFPLGNWWLTAFPYFLSIPHLELRKCAFTMSVMKPHQFLSSFLNILMA